MQTGKLILVLFMYGTVTVTVLATAKYPDYYKEEEIKTKKQLDGDNQSHNQQLDRIIKERGVNTVDQVLDYCLLRFNKSCTCMRRYGEEVHDFACVGFTSQNRCYSNGCQVCKSSSTVQSCGFIGFFKGCKKDCLCSCGEKSHNTEFYTEKIKCNQWCDGFKNCPNGRDERGKSCRHAPVRMLVSLGNLVWLLICVLLISYIFKRRVALVTWMNDLHSHRHAAYQPPPEQDDPDGDNEPTDLPYYGHQGRPPPDLPTLGAATSSVPDNMNDVDAAILPPSYEEVAGPNAQNLNPLYVPSNAQELSPPPSYEESNRAHKQQ